MERELEEYKERAARADSSAISAAASEKIEEKVSDEGTFVVLWR